jgi:isopentenyl diphosphate isomerase/L-lactate dehydrogenase-like FMN-dependent dehydrogenase
VTWDDARRLRDYWGGPFLLKGVQCIEDCQKAIEIGATGVVLSNHGGRQLDGAPPAFKLLPDAVAAVGDKMEVFIDGGIRRGSDVIKSMALGAAGCMIGRPYLYGLAAGGEKGVDRSIQILKDEMVRVLKLIGCDAIHKLNAGYVSKKRL